MKEPCPLARLFLPLTYRTTQQLVTLVPRAFCKKLRKCSDIRLRATLTKSFGHPYGMYVQVCQVTSATGSIVHGCRRRLQTISKPSIDALRVPPQRIQVGEIPLQGRGLDWRRGGNVSALRKEEVNSFLKRSFLAALVYAATQCWHPCLKPFCSGKPKGCNNGFIMMARLRFKGMAVWKVQGVTIPEYL